LSDDLISRALLVGLGLANLSKEAIQKTAKDFIEQSKLSEEEGKRLMKDLQKRSAHAQKEFDNQVQKAVNKALRGLNIAVVKLPPKAAKTAVKSAAKSGKKNRGGDSRGKPPTR
jgi:polyhydroxyalkanoate synthesis regulator phasin